MMTVKQPSPSDHIGQHVTLMDAHRAAKAGDCSFSVSKVNKKSGTIFSEL